MDMSSKIKQLRYRRSLTQEQLAEKLNVSPQAVSKWENAAAMPDIALLPALAEELGVSIDELFDLTKEQKLRRIENRMEMEEELAADVFRDYEEFLTELSGQPEDRLEALSLLARLYHHRMEADARRASRFARETVRLAPEKKDCQWLLQKAEGAVVWDWNVANHSKVIDFYKEVIENDHVEPKTPLPYYDLIDNLLADHRAKEAETFLEALQKLPAHRPFLVPVYRAYIALARFDEKTADAIMEKAVVDFAQEGDMFFEAAQYYARKCDWEKAVDYYEKSYASDVQHKPRFTDALEGIAMIHEIKGEYKEAAATYDRILNNLRDEWGMTEETAVHDAEREKERLLKKR
ncbi:MAG: helix-turn-helix domain-containing protein [Clostridia bacterium]|nr:helix-turn-helix domain-containing protein [Clostridia bacterium]